MSVDSRRGKTKPRIWTPPLRPLTPETSLGFEVIDFASEILGVSLYPWQKWLLIHGLELLEDGSYRFRRVIVLVARQNGKSLLATVLAAWWIFIESWRNPDRVAPIDFKIVGTAQNIDIAREPWSRVKAWCDPDPETDEAAELVVPVLQAATAKVLDSNGKEKILARNQAHYEVRAGFSARGKPAARVLMDELREHKTWDAWNAASQTVKSFWCGQLWGWSNAGTPASIVLKKQRERLIELIEEWDQLVGTGIATPAQYAAEHDTSLALFEWSAADDCPLDDVEGILQANPSIGYGGITVEACISDSRSMPESDYRTEVLCQWVAARVPSYISPRDLRSTVLPSSQVQELLTQGSRTVWGVDTNRDRSMTYVAAAVFLSDGRPFVTIRAQRAGMMWLPEWLTTVAEQSGQWEVAVQSKGCPAMEFVDPLERAGFTVHAIDGSRIGLATGRFRDRVRDQHLVTVDQPIVTLAAEGGVVTRYAENDAWSRTRSATDVSPLVAETVALFGLEVMEPDNPDPVMPPPPAQTVSRQETLASDGVNLASVAF